MGSDEDQHKIGGIAGQQSDTALAGETVVVQAADQQQSSGSNGDQCVDAESCSESHRGDEGGGTDHKQNVEDVAAHDVADGNVCIALLGGGDGGEQLGQGSSESYDGQTDESLAESQGAGNGSSGIHGDVAAQNDAAQTNNGPQGGFPQGAVTVDLGFIIACLAVLGQTEQIAQIHQEETPQDDTVYQGDDSVQAQNQQQDCGEEHEGDFAEHSGTGHADAGERRGQTQNDKNIYNVAADYIADGNVGAAAQCSCDTDGGFGSTGAHGHDGQTDDQLGDAKAGSDAGCAVHEPIGAFYQQNKACGQQQERDEHFHGDYLQNMMLQSVSAPYRRKKRDSAAH